MADEIDVLNPLLPAFTIQHDFRERFFHALQTILQKIDSGDGSAEDLLDTVRTIAFEALDHGSIQLWMDSGRPLPWLDEVLGEENDRLRTEVLKALGLDYKPS